MICFNDSCYDLAEFLSCHGDNEENIIYGISQIKESPSIIKKQLEFWYPAFYNKIVPQQVIDFLKSQEL